MSRPGVGIRWSLVGSSGALYALLDPIGRGDVFLTPIDLAKKGEKGQQPQSLSTRRFMQTLTSSLWSSAFRAGLRSCSICFR